MKIQSIGKRHVIQVPVSIMKISSTGNGSSPLFMGRRGPPRKCQEMSEINRGNLLIKKPGNTKKHAIKLQRLFEYTSLHSQEIFHLTSRCMTFPIQTSYPGMNSPAAQKITDAFKKMCFLPGRTIAAI